jgi:hypothetical protein
MPLRPLFQRVAHLCYCCITLCSTLNFKNMQNSRIEQVIVICKTDICSFFFTKKKYVTNICNSLLAISLELLK